MTSLMKSFSQQCAGLLLTSALAATSVSAQETPAAPEGDAIAAPEERPQFPDKAYCLADVDKEDIVLLPYAALAGDGGVLMGFVGMVEVPPPPEDPEAEATLEPTNCLYKLPRAMKLDDTGYKDKLAVDISAPNERSYNLRRDSAFTQGDETFGKLCAHWEAQAEGADGTLRSKAPSLDTIANAAEGTLGAILREEAQYRCPQVLPALTQ